MLRAIPIPTQKKNKSYFVDAIDEALRNGNIIHFYPEASLWSYYQKLRNFKMGAFHFAVRNQVPVLPIVVTFRRPQGMRRIFKRKSDVTITILKPIQAKEDSRQEMERLKEEVYQAMEEERIKKKGKK